MKTFLDITSQEIEQFISDFNFKGLATINKVEKQNNRKCDAPYDWAKDITYKVIHHFNQWFDISKDNIEDAGIKLTDSGILYRVNESTLTLFKLVKCNNDLQLVIFKKYFTIEVGFFGVPKFQYPYYKYFIDKGFSSIKKSWVFDNNMLINEQVTYS